MATDALRLAVIDALVAATGVVHDRTVVTRTLRGAVPQFVECGGYEAHAVSYRSPRLGQLKSRVSGQCVSALWQNDSKGGSAIITLAGERAFMNNQFFEKPILNSPYAYPNRHWELDESGQPTQLIIETRRRAEFITPIPKPKKRKGSAEQKSLVFDEGRGLSTQEQRYAHTAMINSVRQQVDKWRALPNTNDRRVSPETARLLQHWRHHKFSSIRPFFCQIEAVETAIWLTEVAPQAGKAGEGVLEHLVNANNDANPELLRLALKLATGAGKTTLKAEINEEAWATLNSDTSRAFDKPKSGRIAVKVINHLGDEVMKVFRT